MSTQRNAARATYVLAVVAAVLIGAALVPVVWEATNGPDGSVAVVTIQGPISAATTDVIASDLREVRSNNSVKAVVLSVDSPGGGAAASESLYMSVRRTAEAKPVVAAVEGIGASGAYYAVVPAETIFLTPGSIVGSVGVRARIPADGSPPGEIATGPDKTSGYTDDELRAHVESMRVAFVAAVYEHRGDRLSLSREELSYAKVYAGAAAVDHGVADEIGDQETAIAAAASQAGLDDYAVYRKEPPERDSGIRLRSGANGTVVLEDRPLSYRGVDTVQFLMLYGYLEDTTAGREVTTNATG